MSAGEAAYARAHDALTRLLPDVGDPSERATECLATLRRLGWRWVPTAAVEPVTGPPAPPPMSWHEARARLKAGLDLDDHIEGQS